MSVMSIFVIQSLYPCTWCLLCPQIQIFLKFPEPCSPWICIKKNHVQHQRSSLVPFGLRAEMPVIFFLAFYGPSFVSVAIYCPAENETSEEKKFIQMERWIGSTNSYSIDYIKFQYALHRRYDILFFPHNRFKSRWADKFNYEWYYTLTLHSKRLWRSNDHVRYDKFVNV